MLTLLLMACSSPDADLEDDLGAAKTFGAPCLQTWYRDRDDDGFGNPGWWKRRCWQPKGYVSDGTDCDDHSALTYPGATETCDGQQNDCDDTSWTDDDGLATWVDSSNTVTDETSTLAAGTSTSPVSWTAPGDGTLSFCAGTWYATIDASGVDLDLRGPAGPVYTTVSAASTDSVIYATSTNLSVRGLTLADGSSGSGGGIYVYYGSLDLKYVIIENSAASGDGGGLYIKSADATGENLLFEGNSAKSDGGAVTAFDSLLTWSDVQFVSNKATSNGGAIYGDYSADLTDALFDNNTAGNIGGAVYHQSGTFDLTTSDVLDNTSDFTCGGVYSTYGTVDFDGVVFDGNEGYLAGGAFCVYQGDGTIRSDSATSSVTNNTASLGGGAYLTLSSSDTFESDSTDWGSGGDDNSSYDIYHTGSGGWSWSGTSTFTCDSGGC